MGLIFFPATARADTPCAIHTKEKEKTKDEA